VYYKVVPGYKGGNLKVDRFLDEVARWIQNEHLIKTEATIDKFFKHSSQMARPHQKVALVESLRWLTIRRDFILKHSNGSGKLGTISCLSWLLLQNDKKDIDQVIVLTHTHSMAKKVTESIKGFFSPFLKYSVTLVDKHSIMSSVNTKEKKVLVCKVDYLLSLTVGLKNTAIIIYEIPSKSFNKSQFMDQHKKTTPLFTFSSFTSIQSELTLTSSSHALKHENEVNFEKIIVASEFIKPGLSQKWSCQDIALHFISKPNFKAIFVCSEVEQAVRYQNELQKEFANNKMNVTVSCLFSEKKRKPFKDTVLGLKEISFSKTDFLIIDYNLLPVVDLPPDFCILYNKCKHSLLVANALSALIKDKQEGFIHLVNLHYYDESKLAEFIVPFKNMSFVHIPETPTISCFPTELEDPEELPEKGDQYSISNHVDQYDEVIEPLEPTELVEPVVLVEPEIEQDDVQEDLSQLVNKPSPTTELPSNKADPPSPSSSLDDIPPMSSLSIN